MDQIGDDLLEDRKLTADLRTCVASLERLDGVQVRGEIISSLLLFPALLTETVDTASGHEIWRLIFELVHNLSEVILQTLPSFWKVAKGYMEGKYQKVRSFHATFCSSSLMTTSRRTHRLQSPVVVAVPLNVES